MNLEMSASLRDTDEIKELLIEINEENLEPILECCIYRVPKSIRKINEEAYTPQLISIGPFHHGKEEVIEMEKHKKRYVKSFRDRINIEKWEDILTYIEDNKQRIRNCYADLYILQNVKFVMMILYDAIFIIELFLRNYNRDKSDFLLDIPAVRYALYLDLQLLENQLPFFILKELYKLVDLTPTFMFLSFAFFGDSMFNREVDHEAVKHFTDLRRAALLKTYPSKMESNGWFENVPCAIKLHESGVKFKEVKRECILDIKFEKRKQRIPCFQVHELQIPNFGVYDQTEHLLRNIMALEQCHYPSDTHVCNYVKLMDYLIDTEKDVDLLVGKGIISNNLGDSASLVNMFNKLSLQIHVSESCYYNICEDLKKHHKNQWNHAMATLKRVYFSNPWRGTATIAAIILLLFTVIQTICSIKQVV